jgi:adenylyltransferase/sulfurtransferase
MSGGTPFVVVGAGGLGCPAGLGLAAAEVSTLMVVDDDVVDASNLPRQVLYTAADTGTAKVEAFARRLRAVNPTLVVTPLARRLAPTEVHDFVASLPTDVVMLECSDSPPLKFAVNDAVLRLDRAAVIGGAVGWTGQAVAVERGAPCYRCIFEQAPPEGRAGRCDLTGVAGPVVGATGYHMAVLAVALAHARAARRRGSPTPGPAGRLTHIDGRTATVRTLAPNRRPGCSTCAALTVEHDHGHSPHSHSAA